ncbi:MAG: energy-coupling factor transporter ATPase [Clostridiales bacterium]|nr:energy-coupling factor transporter ATPase [Clostridiales bacterium]MBS5877953.1 energy-coupling factor transporter ATPase [Clostridiales bacterium]MDU0939928.1 energy-coupling factor transporter ATPase [Clostridiales bacterium]MDU1042472.1 energy-coupling factor transporter ATPase [Clostridiales bacterium]MDU3489764.1 energy-coupling factor transporter ATPase [Clostridiales bacterium]
MSIISAENIIFEYENRDEEGNELEPFRALDGVSMEVRQGEFIAVLGHNGSGKSTFAKHLNALLLPGQGRVYIDKMDTCDPANTLKIREKAGMVFQNPDNQLVASVIEEEVAFGPENLGIEPSEIVSRVDNALKAVGMTAYKENSPNRLSGGQKQRIAIAGILAMLPKCIILDEPTAMLDPKGRKDVLSVLHELNKKEGVTIILITHNMEEVIDSDRVFVMDKGKVVMNGSPREVFSRVEELQELRLDVPEVTKLAFEIKKSGISLPDGILTNEELIRALKYREV